MPYELFISYSRKDDVPQKPGDTSGWVTALHDRIINDNRDFSTEPLRIFYDRSEIESFDDWRDKILSGLRESKILLVCLSPGYFSSPPCLWEWEEYLKRQLYTSMGQESVAPIYFVEAPDSAENLSLAWEEAVNRKAVTPEERPQWEKRWKEWRAALTRYQFVDLKPFFPDGLIALQQEEVRLRMKFLGQSLWERIERARRAIGVPGNLQRFNAHFVGRKPELAKLHSCLAHGIVGIVTAINGLGGQGKTELANAYAHSYAYCYPAGLWVLPAEGKRELLPLLAELCGELGLLLSASASETGDERGRRVIAELRRRVADIQPRNKVDRPACLVLLDNVSEPRLLAETQLARLPREDWLRIVVTTREGSEQFGTSRDKSLAFISVGALADEDAVQLVKEHQPDAQWPEATATADAAAALEIVRDLGGFTLAIESVAIYLGLHPEIRPADYRARLQAEGLTSVDELPANAEVGDQMRHCEKQLGVILDQTLSHFNPPERAALDYAALLPPDNVPWSWLRELVCADHPTVLTARQGYEDPWKALRRRLEGTRLLSGADHPDVARLHRMVAAHLKVRIKATASELKSRILIFARRATERLAKATEWGKAGAIWELRTAGGVAENLIETRDEIGITLAALIAHPLIEHWELESAERILRRALALCDAMPGKPVPHRSSILSSLGGVLREKREFPEAERLIRTAIAIDEAQKPADALSLARKWNNLGLLLRDRDLFEEAERAFGKALSLVRGVAIEELRRESDVEEAIVSNNLADLLMERGRWKDAIGLFKSAIDQLTSLFGSSHPDVATANHNLAALYERMGKYDQAVQIYERSLEMYREVFGHKHLRAAATQVNLAVALSRSGESARAERELRSAIQILCEIPEDQRYRVMPMAQLRQEYMRVLRRMRLRTADAKFSMSRLFSGTVLDDREYRVCGLEVFCERLPRPLMAIIQSAVSWWYARRANFGLNKKINAV